LGSYYNKRHTKAA